LTPDHDPTGISNSETYPDWTGFRNKLYRIRYGYLECADHCSQNLNHTYFGYIPDGIKYLDTRVRVGVGYLPLTLQPWYPKIIKHMIMDCNIFCLQYETIVWQCSTEGQDCQVGLFKPNLKNLASFEVGWPKIFNLAFWSILASSQAGYLAFKKLFGLFTPKKFLM